MESRIKELQEKYWKGESTVSEEQELKAYFQENPSLSPESSYFRGLQKMQTPPKTSFQHPGKTSQKTRWYVAAAVTAGLLTTALVVQDARKQHDFTVDDPKEAFEITQKALLMVSSGLNEGKSYTTELSNINKAQTYLQLKQED
ncbi:hypothetical protein [Marinoscillum furvescens]|uniref:Uncharacterized protein n=1 Tax=Marinoscillum furvescens DSM 4134 TaxID=1122208 RepID=A0A3D9L4N5_MARFU|nr:hypothetical protein [Marinoscillum furvescens]RED99452.1 hypothetical protein C7460_10868 [Marinoscillum furvescens DSM 4134]